jgi:5-hydroxyisourate hydrolase
MLTMATEREHGMGRLTTHVLDTVTGRPGSAMRLALYRVDGPERTRLVETTTNDDGRVDQPLLEGESMGRGTYELVFQVGHYFRVKGVDLANPAFLDEVPIRFGIDDPNAHYHVPLLVSPFAYSTYRGS